MSQLNSPQLQATKLSKEDKLKADMAYYHIYEQDIDEQFIRGSGNGGQKINKTSSTVYLKHKPTGIEIKCQDSRSQALNRFLARRKLVDIIKEKIFRQKSEKTKAIEKIRRQKRKRSKRAQEKRLDNKKMASTKKKMRSNRFDE